MSLKQTLKRGAGTRFGVGIKFMVAVVPLVIIVLAVVAVGAYRVLRHTVINLNRDLGAAVVENVADAAELWIEGRVDVVRSLSVHPLLTAVRTAEDRPAAEAAVAGALRQFAGMYPDIEMLAMMPPGESARLIGSRGELADVPPEMAEAIRVVRGGARQHVSGVYPAMGGSGAAMAVVLPVGGNAANGILVAGVTFQPLVSRFTAQNALGATAYVFIGDTAGSLFIHPRADLAMTDAGRAAYVPFLTASNAGQTVYEQEFEGQTNLYTSGSFVPGNASSIEWIVFYRKGLTELLSEVTAVVTIGSVVGLIMLVVVALLLHLVTRGVVTRPLVVIREQLDQIAQGEGDLRRRVRSGDDEVGRIGGSFNAFLQTLSTLIGEIKVTLTANAEIKNQLAAATAESSAAVNQIIANIGSIDTMFGRLDSQIEGAAASTEEIQRNIETLAGQTSNQSAAVSQSTAAVEQMIASLRNVAGITQARSGAAAKLAGGAEQSSELLNETADAIHAVGTNVESIMEMTQVISQIAEQTNLLAMNAAIEAAHAGDAGKGFAVVAQEIRNLAESAAGSSKNIAAEVRMIIDQIRRSESNAHSLREHVQAMIGEFRTIADVFEEIQRSTMELSSGSDQVLRAMTMLNEVSTQVGAATAEMASGAEETARTMVNVTELARTAKGAVSEITVGGNEILKAMSNLQDLAQELSNKTDQLAEQVNRFVV